jgi:hypothetical protein
LRFYVVAVVYISLLVGARPAALGHQSAAADDGSRIDRDLARVHLFAGLDALGVVADSVRSVPAEPTTQGCSTTPASS